MEFDPASQWYNASLTVAAEWLKTGGRLHYFDIAQPPESTRLGLSRLGLDPQELENKEKLVIWDWYTCTMGQKSKEKYAADSLKVADLSIHV